VQNQRVRRFGPSRRRKARAQRGFDSLRILGRREAKTIRDAQHMTIDRQTRQTEGVAAHDIRRLSTDTWEFHQRRHV